MRFFQTVFLVCLLSPATVALADEVAQEHREDVLLLLNGYHGADEVALNHLDGDVRATLAALCLDEAEPGYLRARALGALGAFANEANIEVYAAALRSNTDEVRHAAIWFLAVNHPQQAAVHIAGSLNDTNPDLRITAVLALHRIDTPEAHRLLAARTLIESDARVLRHLHR